MNMDNEILLRYLEGSLSDKESTELQFRLDSEPDLRIRLEEIQSIRTVLDDGKPDSFRPFFSDRVMKRLAGNPQTVPDSLYDSLQWIFVRAAVACVLVAIVIGSYNVLNYQDLDVSRSLVEALFGLPSAELTDALDYGAL